MIVIMTTVVIKSFFDIATLNNLQKEVPKNSPSAGQDWMPKIPSLVQQSKS